MKTFCSAVYAKTRSVTNVIIFTEMNRNRELIYVRNVCISIEL